MHVIIIISGFCEEENEDIITPVLFIIDVFTFLSPPPRFANNHPRTRVPFFIPSSHHRQQYSVTLHPSFLLLPYFLLNTNLKICASQGMNTKQQTTNNKQQTTTIEIKCLATKLIVKTAYQYKVLNYKSLSINTKNK